MTIVVRSASDPGEVLIEGKTKATGKVVEVWWDGERGEELYRLRDVSVWVAPSSDDPDRPALFTQWTDDTERNPRKQGIPAGVTTTREDWLPGGSIGPFLISVE